MAKYCPAKGGPALYMDCTECGDRECKRGCLLGIKDKTGHTRATGYKKTQDMEGTEDANNSY